ncbi:aquaporin 12 [Sphaeramia orbicularis]|uniref:aquaporin 12 n=1 Tax=Sphaeramia orbicularis TaxID=375764 RepID=UPI00117C8CBA|nr:aquaporin-12-like [Sphaeramia orbicularis]
MSGLNASLGYFVAAVIFVVTVKILLKKWPRFSFILEFASSFMLVACWLEVQTIVEIGQWAGGLGPDVTVTILFVMMLTHGVICGTASGNPSLTLMKFLQLEAPILSTVLAVAAQFAGAHLGLIVAQYYWSLELTDMHMIKNLMYGQCSTSLMVSMPQGFFTESTCALIFCLIYLKLSRRSAFIRVPLIALLLTFLSYTARQYTSAFMNPSLAYGLTFHCPGNTFTQYAVVYWLGPLTGMMVALLLYVGHIPRIFAKNLLYSQKTRFKGPKVETGDKKKI